MKNFYFLSIVLFFLMQCNTYRQAEKELVMGNFDEALDRMITKKSNGINPKKYETWVYLMHQSYLKANNDDLMTISRYSKDIESVSKYRIIYNRYCDLVERHNKIKALLPIKIHNRIVNFEIKNFNNQLAQSKDNLAQALAKDALIKMNTNNKYEARQAYYNYMEIQELMPYFENLNQLKTNAFNKGVDKVKVSVNNFSGAYLPPSLSNALINYTFLNDNKFWYHFYTESTDTIDYDYEVSLNFDLISITPEEVYPDFRRFHKKIQDGEDFVLDEDGEKELDSLGQPIKVKRFINVHAQSEELRLYKTSTINAYVMIKNYNNTTLNQPLSNTFIFEDFSANIRGDFRALPHHYRRKFKKYPMNFPSDEQMIYDNGIMLKLQLKNIIDDYFS